ncbi:MAG: hypothetical protein K1060chlam4_00425 [Candidatus Anoxychlamydiales bacterium]|nr:hypothetical protein [Candidatus Anoxychlamydiales bacterium]
MTTNQINNNSPNQGVGLYKIMQEQNKLILGEANLMITLGKLMNALNSAISADTLDLKKITDNLNMLNRLDIGASKLAMFVLIAAGGLMPLTSMVAEAEPTEEASTFTKYVTKANQRAQGMASPKMQLLLGGFKSAIGAGVIISCLQAYFTANTGIDNSQVQGIRAYSDGEQEDVKLVSGSENRSSQTIQAITKAEQKVIQNDYKSSTQQIYYNN